MAETTGSEWDWMPAEYPDGIRLWFARGVATERVIEAFLADPATACELTAEQALETLDSWVQIGRAGEWAFAIDNSSLGYEQTQRIARALSAGTELALFETGPNFDHFYYFADGDEVTSFEPLLSQYRSGSDPDRFLPYMRQAGLNVDPPPEDDDSFPDLPVALLEMLTLALGIRLSRDIALGSLLTVRPSVS